MKQRLSILIVALAAASPLFSQETEHKDGKEVAARQVIVKLRNLPDNAVLTQLKGLTDADDLRALSRDLNLYLLHSRTGNVTALMNLLQRIGWVEFAEPDFILNATRTPNDTYFPQLWGLANAANPGKDIAANLAWDVSTGSTATVVGVVDSGIDYNHPDLAPNVWSAPSSFTVNLSWGQLTCPAGSHGYNAIARTCDPMDDNNHGSHVSGTIGAAGNNGTGVVGVNWAVRLMGLKFLSSSGSGSTSNAIDAIEFALQAKTRFGSAANVRVFSNSWGGPGYSQALLAEINKANTADALFVVAAGNTADNNDTKPSYPAAFNAPNIVTVAATTNSDALASFSSYGPNTVHLGAPGVSILSTIRNGSYAYFSGTSMATPHVAGAAALVLAGCQFNTAALKNALLSNVDPVPALAGITVTGGRLNVNRAIRSCSAAPPPAPAGTATFVKTDTTTMGTWKGVYGADGAHVIGDNPAYPSYVTVTPASYSTWVWAYSTADVRGLLKSASTTDRMAGCWYTSSSFTMAFDFTDTSTHQVAIYMVDWDSYRGRSQRVDVLNASGALLDTRTVSNFVQGTYLVWNLSGHVTLRVTNINASSNAVVSGIFFGGASAPPPPPPPAPTATAVFLRTDTSTAGSWKGIYGADGANVIGESATYPSYVQVTPASYSSWTWAGSTTDLRALQKRLSSTDRIASCWYSGGTFTVDMNFTDQAAHQVALYLLDWDHNNTRSQRVEILDTNNKVLDTRTVTAFSGGQYLVWNLSGHVVVRITNTSSINAVLSGIFFR